MGSPEVHPWRRHWAVPAAASPARKGGPGLGPRGVAEWQNLVAMALESRLASGPQCPHL